MYVNHRYVETLYFFSVLLCDNAYDLIMFTNHWLKSPVLPPQTQLDMSRHLSQKYTDVETQSWTVVTGFAPLNMLYSFTSYNSRQFQIYSNWAAQHCVLLRMQSGLKSIRVTIITMTIILFFTLKVLQVFPSLCTLEEGEVVPAEATLLRYCSKKRRALQNKQPKLSSIQQKLK